eukprot:GEMP01035227.1.p1 GENE.GEMP01035227.1~~GEMP01035227.1.p1  ORF type:complete len:367 (+),score=64.86 GEMP01035227.1:45-1145(+)
MTHRFVISLEDTEEQCLRYKNEVMGLFARLGFPNTFNAQFDAIATKSTSRSVSPAPIISPPSAPSAPAPPCPTPMHPNKIPTAPSCAPSPSRNQWRRRSPARPNNGPPRRQPANVDRHPVLRGANLVPVGPSPVANINKPAPLPNGHPQIEKELIPIPRPKSFATSASVPRTLSTRESQSACDSHSAREKRQREAYASPIDDSDDFSAYSDVEPERKERNQGNAHPALRPVRMRRQPVEIGRNRKSEVGHRQGTNAQEQQKGSIAVQPLNYYSPRNVESNDENPDIRVSQELAQKTFSGTIKTYNERRRYFFVNCPEISNEFGKDPLLIPADGNPENYKAQQKISFGITSKRGYTAPVIEWVQMQD